MSHMAMQLYHNLKGDKWIWAILVLLSLASMLTVYSASKNIVYSKGFYSTEYYLMRQLIMILLGFAVTYVVHRIHFMHFWKAAYIIYPAVLLLLLYTLFFGIEINNARRWVSIPFLGFTIQSSDIAKLALITVIAKLLSIKAEQFGSDRNMFGVVLGVILSSLLLIAPADLSTAGIIFIACFILMFVGNMKLKYLLGIVGIFMVGLLLVVALGSFFPESARVSTWMNRMNGFFVGGGDAFQITLSKIAIANGGLIGVGPGNSAMAGILPSSYSDFIYAIISEEYGFVGAVGVLIAYVILLYRITIIVTKCEHRFGALLAYGLGMLVLIQAFFNIAVSLNLVPVTGLTLPMVSRGGTSTILTAFAFGMILSVSNYSDRYEVAKKFSGAEIEENDTENSD